MKEIEVWHYLVNAKDSQGEYHWHRGIYPVNRTPFSDAKDLIRLVKKKGKTIGFYKIRNFQYYAYDLPVSNNDLAMALLKAC